MLNRGMWVVCGGILLALAKQCNAQWQLPDASEIEAAIVNPYGIQWDRNENGEIQDGGLDMYDVGNQITTSICSSQLAPYTDDMLEVSSDCFGSGGSYRMDLLNSMMVLISHNTGDEDLTITISGDLGADGQGSHAASEYTAGPLRGYMTSVCDATDPSVNHLFIIDFTLSPDASHTFDTSTNEDQDSVSGIGVGSPVVYILYSSTSGGCHSDDEHRAIFEAAVAAMVHENTGPATLEPGIEPALEPQFAPAMEPASAPVLEPGIEPTLEPGESGACVRVPAGSFAPFNGTFVADGTTTLVVSGTVAPSAGVFCVRPVPSVRVFDLCDKHPTQSKRCNFTLVMAAMTEFINVAQLNESVSDSVTAQQSLSRSVLAATWCRCQGYVETLRRHSRIGSIPVSNTCSNPPASSVYSGQPQPLPTLPSFRTNSSNATASNGTLETNLIFGNGTARTNLTSGNGTARTNYNDTDNTYANESISAVPQVIQTCVRVTTGVVNNSEGTLEIFVDGVEVTSSESTVYAEGSIVVDECFVHNASEILSIGARNPTNNEWVGVFELYRNSSVIGTSQDTMILSECSGCEGDGDGSGLIVLDGDGNGLGLAPMSCLHGAICTLQVGTVGGR